MTTLRIAAQAALEALELIISEQRHYSGRPDERILPAVDGLGAALAAEPPSTSTTLLIDAAQRYAANYDDDGRQDIRVDVLNAFYAGSKFNAAEPAQEPAQPVATWGECCGIIRAGVHAPETVHAGSCRERHGGELGPMRYLYAAPPQRRPLSDLQISDLVYACEQDNGGDACSYHELARAIEAEHGIKP